MSLIEMMIAMTISLIVIGAVSGVYLSTSRSYTQDELISRMQENARYALHTLAQEVSMAGYWGPLISGGDINTTPRTCEPASSAVECQGLSAQSTLAVDVDCAPGTIGVASNWAITIDPPIEYMNQVTSGSAANTAFACITASDFLDGSDILAVKRVEGTEHASTRNDGDDDQHIFIRTNGLDASLLVYDDDLNVSEGADISDWRYRATVYYIRDYFLDADDGIPTLARQSLDRDDMEPEPGGIAQGIEYFHVMFGVDNNADAVADFYTSSPATTELNNITSARIYVLARSAAPDPNYTNNKTYQVGDVSRTFNDNFYRRVFTTTITLRNQRNRIKTTGN